MINKRELILITIILAFVFAAGVSFLQRHKSPVEFARAKVLHVEEDVDYAAAVKVGAQEVTLQILTGGLKGQVLKTTNRLRGDWQLDANLEAGDIASVALTPAAGGGISVSIVDHSRTGIIYSLVILFLVLLLVFGHWHGLRTIIALTFTLAMIICILLPLILSGWNPILATVLTAVSASFVTMGVVTGLNEKALVASLGVSVGVVVAGALGIAGGNLMKLSGATTGFEQMLYFAGHTNLSLRDIFYSGIIISSLGALMDVAIEMASALYEIRRRRPGIKMRELWESGMNIGRDVMGTMANTLILVYTGASMGLCLFFLAQNTNLDRILNFNFVASEILRALAGSVSLVITIPVTAFLGSWLYVKKLGG